MKMKKNEKHSNIGIGNVSGNHSSSENKIDISIGSGEKKGASSFLRLFSFLLGLASMLKIITLFFQAMNGVEEGLVFQIIFLTVIALLGILGFLHSEDIASIFTSFFGKK